VPGGYSLDVDRLRADVGRRAAHGGALVIAGEVARVLLNLASTAVLARTLVPEAFGLLAMVWALAGFAALFTDLGLALATIQRREITEAQVNALFWVNAGAGLVLSIGVAALAPAVAWFYGDARLNAITIALASAFLVSGIAVQHRALLTRQMRFNALVAIDLSAAVGGTAVALVLAALGYGYWALVANVLGTTALSTALSWALCGWRPGFPSRVAGLSSLLSFGGHLTGFTVVNYLARNLDNVLIGWWWGPSAVALYDQAYKLLLLPVQRINGPAGRVMAPALSHIRADGSKWARAYCRSAMAVLLIGAPLSTFCFVFADLIIPVFLGSQWADAVPIFRYLAISGVAQCLYNTLGWIYVSSGRTDRMFRWGLASSAAICASFLIGLPFGPTGVAIAYSTTVAALTVPAVLYACRTTPLMPAQVFSTALPPMVASVLAGLCAYALRIHMGSTTIPGVGLAVAAFLLTYCAFLLPWHGPRDTIAFAVRKFRTAAH
jgi:O-antigen/teichoic acid export membrane protein